MTTGGACAICETLENYGPSYLLWEGGLTMRCILDDHPNGLVEGYRYLSPAGDNNVPCLEHSGYDALVDAFRRLRVETEYVPAAPGWCAEGWLQTGLACKDYSIQIVGPRGIDRDGWMVQLFSKTYLDCWDAKHLPINTSEAEIVGEAYKMLIQYSCEMDVPFRSVSVEEATRS